MLAAVAFQKAELDEISRARIDQLKAIALDPIDFDSWTPDQQRKVTEGKEKQSASRASKEEHGIKDSSDWLDGSEGGSLGMTIFGMDAEN